MEDRRLASPAVRRLTSFSLANRNAMTTVGEHLEEALDPEVDDPPPPVLGDGEVGVPAVPQRGAVENPAIASDDSRKSDRIPPLLVATPERREDRAGDQEEPEEQADEQGDLEGPAEVDVLVAAVADVEPERPAREHLLHAEPLPCHRTEHHHQQRPEQHVDAEPLELRLAAADGRPDVQAGRQPGGRDPEDSELEVPGAGHGVRQDGVDWDPVEAAPFDSVVGHEHSERDLEQQEPSDGPEILHGGAL